MGQNAVSRYLFDSHWASGFGSTEFSPVWVPSGACELERSHLRHKGRWSKSPRPCCCLLCSKWEAGQCEHTGFSLVLLQSLFPTGLIEAEEEHHGYEAWDQVGSWEPLGKTSQCYLESPAGMFPVALSARAKNAKEPKYLLRGEWRRKWQSSHI